MAITTYLQIPLYSGSGGGGSSTPPNGRPVVSGGLIRRDYSTSNITSGAYTQIIASTAAVINELYIWDSSGQDIILAVGGAGSEVNQLYIQPGGNRYDLAIPAGSRISLKSLVAATINSGEFLLTALG